MNDRITKASLSLIVLGIWGLLLRLLLGPFPVQAAPPAHTDSPTANGISTTIPAITTAVGNGGFNHVYVIEGSTAYMLVDDGYNLRLLSKAALH